MGRSSQVSLEEAMRTLLPLLLVFLSAGLQLSGAAGQNDIKNIDKFKEEGIILRNNREIKPKDPKIRKKKSSDSKNGKSKKPRRDKDAKNKNIRKSPKKNIGKKSSSKNERKQQ